MWALVPVREPRGPAGPRGPLIPVRLDLLVPVGGTNRDQWASLLAHHHWSRLVAWTGTKGFPLVPVQATNRDQLIAYIYPASRALPLLCFSWPTRRELCGALAHLLCTRGVRWNAWDTLLKLSPLQAPPPSSIFLNIYLGLAVRHVPSPSSPPSIAPADLVTGTTVVSLLLCPCFSYFYYCLLLLL